MQWFDVWKRMSTAEPVSWFCDVLWGGNRFVHQQFTVPGFKGVLLSVSYADSEQGGDIYYVTVCGHGVFTKFLLADVAGHGDGASPLSRRLQRPLKELMEELDNTAILAALNQAILEMGIAGQFATAAAATYNHWDKTWVYAYAGHPAILLRTEGGWQPLEDHGKSSIPVGILGDNAYYQNTRGLGDGDWVLMFTDALMEIPLADGSRLGLDGLIRVLDGIGADSLGGFYRRLVETLVETNGSEHFQDDLTMILLKHEDRAEGSMDRLGQLARRWAMGMKKGLQRTRRLA